MSGWIKLHRKILQNIELMNDDTAFLLFTRLLLLSNQKGQIGMSGRHLAKRTHINYSTLRKALKRLEEYQMVTQSRTHRYTLILICNWDKYQANGTHFGTRTGRGRDADGTQLTGILRIENKNKEKDDDEYKKSKARKFGVDTWQ